MTLKEKLHKTIDWNLGGSYEIKNEVEIECEKIADDYAIEFAKWTQDQDYRNDYDNCHLTMEQLLKIFKEEKRL